MPAAPNDPPYSIGDGSASAKILDDDTTITVGDQRTVSSRETGLERDAVSIGIVSVNLYDGTPTVNALGLNGAVALPSYRGLAAAEPMVEVVLTLPAGDIPASVAGRVLFADGVAGPEVAYDLSGGLAVLGKASSHPRSPFGRSQANT